LLAELGPDGVLEHAFEACIAAKVITVPSTMFKAAPEVDSAPENVFLRCSFSYNTPEEMEEGAKRFGAGLRKSFEGSAS
jgi:DNA-binding transcriptional MocR family regulator